MKKRRIIHVDMDAFFASVEELDNPSLSGKPVIVGGHQTKRGVVSSANYLARSYGVKAAMPLWQAKQLCPDGVFLPVRMHRYAEISRKFLGIFLDYTPLVEPMGFDEAYLDVTGSEHLFGEAREMGREIQRRVKEEIGLSCSVGISYNKFLAKIASGWKKPGGLFQILEEDALEFLKDLPLEELPGVGYATRKRLERMGLKKVGELCLVPLEILQAEFGKLALDMLNFAKGVDPRPVLPVWERKSLGEEATFEEDLSDLDKLLAFLLEASDRLGKTLREEGRKARRITLKVRFPNFKTITRSLTLPHPTDIDDEIFQAAKSLLFKSPPKRVRLLGLQLSGLTPYSEGFLFPDSLKRSEALLLAIDRIKFKYGEGAISRAVALKKGKEGKSPPPRKSP
ncbi:MAG: DNA polymerase IV [Caldiserica bacterium]|nr:DNA polymerase IV [Caldisericota bacterium]MDH7562417.1 DNA polymerase IV [Caldisericota bacterium]